MQNFEKPLKKIKSGTLPEYTLRWKIILTEGHTLTNYTFIPRKSLKSNFTQNLEQFNFSNLKRRSPLNELRVTNTPHGKNHYIKSNIIYKPLVIHEVLYQIFFVCAYSVVFRVR